MQQRSNQVAAPQLEENLVSDLTAVVYDVEQAGKNFQLLLTDLEVAELDKEQTPKFIQIRILNKYNDELLPGDFIEVKEAKLFVNQSPLTVNGYDWQFFNWFKQLGATGYSPFRPLVRVEQQEAGFRYLINQTRTKLAWKIDETSLSEDNKRLTKAILLGYRKDLHGSAVEEQIRLSGVGHILAISGLHMALCAALVFTLLRSLLALSSYLALHYHLKKWAAVVSFLVVGIYFCLSGFSVSAQRAYLMISLSLTALLLDRPPVFMRILCLTALTILVLNPEQVFSLGFQMSFLAVLVISRTSSWLTSFLTGRSVNKPIRYLLMATLISGAASLVTSIIGFQSFNYFGLYNFFTNLIVLPLVGLVVLPLILLLGILLPLGLERLVIYPLSTSLNLIDWITARVANLPYSYLELASINHYYWGLGLILLTFALCYRPKHCYLLLLLSLLVFGVGKSVTVPVTVYLRAGTVGIINKNNQLYFLPSSRCESWFVKRQLKKPTEARIVSAQKLNLACAGGKCVLPESKLTVQVTKTADHRCGKVSLLGIDQAQPVTAKAGETRFFRLEDGKLVEINKRQPTKPWRKGVSK